MEITVGPGTLLLTYQHVTSVTWKKDGETTCFVGGIDGFIPLDLLRKMDDLSWHVAHPLCESSEKCFRRIRTIKNCPFGKAKNRAVFRRLCPCWCN